MTREELLQKLLAFNEPVEPILKQLNTYGWDSEERLVTVTKQDVVLVLQRYLKAELTAEDVEQWANALECRDDVGYESADEEILKSIMHDLANPLLEGPLSEEVARDLVGQLE